MPISDSSFGGFSNYCALSNFLPKGYHIVLKNDYESNGHVYTDYRFEAVVQEKAIADLVFAELRRTRPEMNLAIVQRKKNSLFDSEDKKIKCLADAFIPEKQRGY